MDGTALPVAVVGAGPVGLAAAAELLEQGLEPLVLEAGTEAAAAVREWGHVRLFSPWEWVVDPAAQRLLEKQGWVAPDPEQYPTGAEWVERYLAPLAQALGGRVVTGARVVGVTRRGRDRVVDAGRDTEPLVIHVLTSHGEERVLARAVVDASGTWTSANPLGGDGMPAIGERAAAGRVRVAVPDLADAAERARYAGRHVVVAGSGHSCKELRDLIGPGFQGCMRIPAGPVGGVEWCSEGGSSGLGLVALIASAGLVTGAPDEGSRPAPVEVGPGCST